MNEEDYFGQIFQAIADWFNETTAIEEYLTKISEKGGGDL